MSKKEATIPHLVIPFEEAMTLSLYLEKLAEDCFGEEGNGHDFHKALSWAQTFKFYALSVHADLHVIKNKDYQDSLADLLEGK